MYLGHLTNIIASILQHDGLLRAANVHSNKLAIQMLKQVPVTQRASAPEKAALLLVDLQASDANQAVCCLALNRVPGLLVH